METLLHVALAMAALGVPLACAYLGVRRIGRHPPPHKITGTGRNGGP